MPSGWPERCARRFGTPEITIAYTSPIIGAHSGPGTLALFFLATGR